MKEKETRCIIIPENVLYCKKIPANAKLLYGEILDLCNDKGYCWASNNHFADHFGISEKSVSRLIASLKKNRFIKCEVKKNNSRKIFVMGDRQKRLSKCPVGGGQKCLYIIKGQEHPSGIAPAISKDDFNIETEEWIDEDGQKHGRDSIDYES